MFIAQGLAGNSIKIAYVTPNSRGGEGVTDSEDDEPSSMQKFKQVPITNWNTLDAFGKFLQLEGDREQALQGHVNPTSTSASVPQEAALPFRDSTPCASETESDGDMSLASDGFLFPFALSAITPYPSHPARRRRVEKAERRLEKLTRSGLSTMCSSDEEDPVRDPQRGTLDTSDDGDGRDKCEDWDPFGDEAEL